MLEPDVGGWESGLGKPVESLSGNSSVKLLNDQFVIDQTVLFVRPIPLFNSII